MATSSQLQTQADFDNLGRIHKDAYVGSVSALFATCWIAAAIRFHIRFGILKSFSWDDGFLVIGLICMTTMFGLLLGCIDDAYATTAALEPNGLSLALRPGFIQRLFNYKKMIDVVLMLAWGSILCVKLSYLFLFRRLIDRVRFMGIYWWVVFLYVMGTAGYVFAVYYLVCPYYDSFAAIQCITGDGIFRTVRYTISQIVLDIIGDLFILVFPFYILYKIKIQTKQKLGLATSLCLTVVIIAMSIIRIAGIITPDGKLDQLWDGYWNIITAEVGLIMTSATAFRALYISKTGSNSGRAQRRRNTSYSAPQTTSSSTSRISRFATWWRSLRSQSDSAKTKSTKNVSATSNSTWSNNSNHNFPIQGNVSQLPAHVMSQRSQRQPLPPPPPPPPPSSSSSPTPPPQQQHPQQPQQQYHPRQEEPQEPQRKQTQQQQHWNASLRRTASTATSTNTNTNTNTHTNTKATTMTSNFANSENTYEAEKLRARQMFAASAADPWDYEPPTDHVDRELLTKRALIEAACKVYRRDTAV